MDNITKIFVKRENVLLEHGDYYIDPSVSKKLTDKDVDIKAICKKYGIKKYTVNSDGSIDVDGNVNISGKGLTKLPLTFGKVTGNFSCINNRLTTLEGCPTTVSGYFYCFNNQLTTLEGCPTSVGRGFFCDNNKLTSLDGLSKTIGDEFYCDNIKKLWNASSETFKASHAKDAWAIKNKLTVLNNKGSRIG